MAHVIRHKVFIYSFLATYFLFFIVTIYVFEIKAAGVAMSLEYGFPFTYYLSHCFGGTYLYSGLLGNVFFALTLATAVAMVCSYSWLKLLPKIGTAVFHR